MCDYCDRPSSIPGFVESASALLYAVAGVFALGTIAVGVARVRRGTPIDVPTPITLLISLLAFYVAVEAAKVYWVPLKALSDHEVEKSRSTWNKFTVTFVVIVVAALLLRKCGY